MDFIDMFGKQAGITQTEVVEGAPRKIGEKEIVPLARVTSFTRNFGKGESGWLGLFVRIKPLAVLERTPDKGTRRIPVRDVTGEIMKVFCAMGLFTLVFCVLLGIYRFRRTKK